MGVNLVFEKPLRIGVSLFSARLYLSLLFNSKNGSARRVGTGCAAQPLGFRHVHECLLSRYREVGMFVYHVSCSMGERAAFKKQTWAKHE